MAIKHYIAGDDDTPEAWTWGASGLNFAEALSLMEHLANLMQQRRAKRAELKPASGIEAHQGEDVIAAPALLSSPAR